MASNPPIPKRGAAAAKAQDETAKPGEKATEASEQPGQAQQDGAAQGSGGDSGGQPDVATALATAEKAKADKEAEDLRLSDAEKARPAKVNEELSAADKQNLSNQRQQAEADKGLTDMQRAQLAQAYNEGPALIAAKRVTMEQAVRDLSTHFKLPPEEVRAKLEAGIRKLQQQAVADAEDTVLCNVPRAFNLRPGPGKVVPIRKGPQRLPRSYAEHWYSKNNGVTIVD